MEKENLEIKKASEELTAEDLERVTGGTTGMRRNCREEYCPKDCGSN